MLDRKKTEEYMPRRSFYGSLAIIIITAGASAAAAQTPDLPFTAAEIEAAAYAGGDLPAGRSALTAKVQVLLDRSGTSPGVIDGFKGGMSESAIRAFERRVSLPVDGIMDPHVWNLLQSYAGLPATQSYTITEADMQGLVDAIPADYAEKAKMSSQGYTSIAEKLGERFHMDEKFIAFLNPGVTLAPGATINVTAPGSPMKTKVSRIIIDKATRRVAAYNDKGRMIVDYPATIGSDSTPSPSGNHHVVTVAINPNYTYNPNKNFKQGNNDKVLIVPPGPNGPVGTVWIDLSQPSYGIHGTSSPSRLFHNQSYGCVRLTNWDAEELAGMVQPGITSVEFLAPGISIADVTGSRGDSRSDALATASTAAVRAVSRPAHTPQMTTKPADPLAFPAMDGAPPMSEGQVYENTSEEAADNAARVTGQDLLSDALSQALPDGQVASQP
jgi:lipoprotein-anchoring transpeptidase ErfK/SrfK